jgi:hypothetical protein
VRETEPSCYLLNHDSRGRARAGHPHFATTERRCGTPRALCALAKSLAENEAKIVVELNAVQGKPVDIGGYYTPNPDLATKAMCPSPTFDAVRTAPVTMPTFYKFVCNRRALPTR